jgi:hypothetical protein
MLCPRNCRTCSDANTCTQCNKGFVVTPAGTCRGCIMACSDCSQSDITQCTACANGLQLVNSKCIQCPDNCLQCNNGNCQTCIPGYTPNTAGTCVPNCILPCATCVDNKPSVCTSCFSSATLSNGTCVLSLSCNSTGTCTDCGQGLGYFLLGQYCYSCSQIVTISNCLQCSQANQQVCSICNDGFYLDSTGLCPACPSSCLTCIGSTLCTSCQLGYTLPSDQSQNQCIQCLSPCATCYGTSTYCTTCISGFTKNGWKCQNNTHISFTITLSGATTSSVVTNIDSIISALLQYLGQSSTNVDVITIQSIVAGSAILTASASPSGSISTAASGLQSGLSGTTLSGYTISSASVTTVSPNSSDSSNTNVGLIVGLTVGLFCFVGTLTII